MYRGKRDPLARETRPLPQKKTLRRDAAEEEDAQAMAAQAMAAVCLMEKVPTILRARWWGRTVPGRRLKRLRQCRTDIISNNWLCACSNEPEYVCGRCRRPLKKLISDDRGPSLDPTPMEGGTTPRTMVEEFGDAFDEIR